MANYDSILKEKKKYEEPIKKEELKKFPKIKMSLFLIIIVLITSYIVYFMKILTPKQIFLNDIKIIIDKYSNILEPLNISKLNDTNYNLIGNITLNDKEYNFSLNKKEEKLNLNLTLDKNTLNYHTISNQNYIKLSNYKEQYYKLQKDDYYSTLSNLKQYLLNNLTEDQFIKKFYLNGTTPIVESNLTLNNEDIKNILKSNTEENLYDILITLKNHAITNEIIKVKLTINNQTTNKRMVIIYENGYLTYNDDNQSLKFRLEEKNNDFTLKIYKDDILFSVLTGTASENSYKYTYQVIDMIYNINLNASTIDNNHNYEISSIIEQEESHTEQKLTLTFNYVDELEVENAELSSAINYNNLTEKEKNIYQSRLDNIIGDLKEFIDKHKYRID